MSISYINSSGASGATVTLPSGISAGDYILVYGHRTTAAAPANPTGFTNVDTYAGNSNGARVSYKIADGSESGTTVTSTNATAVSSAVYRGVGAIGSHAKASLASSSSQTIPALTLLNTTGTSWVTEVIAATQTVSISTPSNATLRNTATGATDMQIIGDSNTTVSSWGSDTATNGAAAVGGYIQVELIDTSVLAYVGELLGSTSLGATSPVSTNLPSYVPVGTYLVLIIGSTSASTTGVSVSDSKSNSWNIDISQTTGFYTALASAYIGTALTTSDTITVTWTTGTIRIQLEALSGVASSSSLDKTAGNGNAVIGTSFSAGTTATTTAANEIVIAGWAFSQTLAASLSPGAGYTLFTSVARTAGQYQIVSSTGAYNPTATETSGQSSYGGVTATYKQAGGAPPAANSGFFLFM